MKTFQLRGLFLHLYRCAFTTISDSLGPTNDERDQYCILTNVCTFMSLKAHKLLLSTSYGRGRRSIAGAKVRGGQLR